MDPRGTDAYREGLEHTIEKADELIKTFNALLLIARLEAGVLEENAEQFDPGELVRDVAELYEPVAEERGLKLALDIAEGSRPRGQPRARGPGGRQPHRQRHQVFGEGRSDRRRRRDRARMRIERRALRSRSPTTAPALRRRDRERVLKRFVRLEKSRTEPGTGLGLSLVQAVARLHGGAMRLEDNAPGLRVILRIPRRPADR